MAITIGSHLGSFEVTGLLGRGGMGEVYRARDSKLKRDVAIKTLPDEFNRDPDRIGRFQREAEALAALNHPNIAGIYEVQESNQIRFLVLELVEGETLAERIARGAIPVDEAVRIARQIVAALEAAHERGLIHRDLKPANIKITPEGDVKVLDFGLAKALQEERPTNLSNSPTMMSAVSGVGTIIGTAAYMSPEQARGRQVDKRTDIWAFGCVLYEMLSGVNPFSGETITDIVASVVQREPDWNLLLPSTPQRLTRLLRHCLEKDAKRRLRDIGDSRFDLVERDDTPAVAEKSGVSTRVLIAVVAGAVLLAGVAFVAGARFTNRTPNTELTRMSIVLPEGHRVVSGPVISNDGKRIAFASTDGNHPPALYLRTLDNFELRALPGTDEASQPFFSPDGRWLAYFAKGDMYKLDLDTSAAPVKMAAAPAPNGGTWAADGTIVFVPSWNGGLFRLPASGGKPELWLTPDPAKKEYALTLPYFLPNGKELLIASWGSKFSIERLTLADKTRTVVAPGFWTSAVYSLTGHVIVGHNNGDVMAQPYGSQTTTPTPVAVLQNVYWGGIPSNGWFSFALSRSGTLAYAPANIARRTIVIVDEAGQTKPVLADERRYLNLSLSPEGRRVAVIYDGDLWVSDLDRGGSIRVAPESLSEDAPVWARDGSKVYFGSNSEGNWNIYSKSASGSGSMEPVLKQEGDQFPDSVAPDGTIAYREVRTETGDDIRLLGPDGKNRPWLATKARERDARFSPDGRFIAYDSDATGRREVYIQPVNRNGDRVQISTEGGALPQWSPKGDVLFYRHANAMMAVDIQTSGRLTAGKPRRLFEGGWQLPGDTPFSVMPDGKHFLMVKFAAEAIPTRIDVVFNWSEELKKKVP